MDEQEKAEEVARIKEEYGGGAMMNEPSVGDNDLFGGEGDESTPEGNAEESAVAGTPERTPVLDGRKATPVSVPTGQKQVQG